MSLLQCRHVDDDELTTKESSKHGDEVIQDKYKQAWPLEALTHEYSCLTPIVLSLAEPVYWGDMPAVGVIRLIKSMQNVSEIGGP